MIGAETFSRILDWTDRTTCVLFGDGAGAVVLEAAARARGRSADRGVLASHLRSDGRHQDKLYVDGGPSTTGTVGHLRMEGNARCSSTRSAMIADVIEEAFDATGLSADDIDWFVPHQANRRIIDGIGAKARHSARKGGRHRRPARQHLGGLDSAGAGRGCERRAHQAGRPAC